MAFTQRVSSILVAVVILLVMTSVASIGLNNATPTASATFPGINGKIAFVGGDYGGISVMNPDGSGRTKLTDDGLNPTWSPDGTKIAFRQVSFVGITVMNADGTNVKQLTNMRYDSDPTWSPDGTKIVFIRVTSENPFRTNIFFMNADGTGVRQLTNVTDTESQSSPEWSPDGTKIAFSCQLGVSAYQICVVNASDGSGFLTLADGYDPTWSPDGKKIAFSHDTDIYVMNAADGSGKTRLTHDHGFHPSWSPDGTKIAFSVGEGAEGRTYSINAADGAGQTLLTASSWNPSWGTNPPSPQKHFYLNVKSVDLSGKPLEGLWTDIRGMDGTFLRQAFTPFTFTGDVGTTYSVRMEDYFGQVFHHWQDNNNNASSTDIKRIVTLPENSSATLTAVYDTGNSVRGFTPLTTTYSGGPAKQEQQHQPALTVNAATIIEGNNTTMLHMWMIIDPQQSTITTTNSSGTPPPTTTYKVYATNGYQNLVFDHWSDNGSTDRFRTLRINEPTTITAYYRAG